MTIASGGIKRDLTLLSSGASSEERIFPEAVARELLVMLGRVVSEGTGKKAAVDAYAVAGKTGTARKIGKEGYDDSRHIAFFAGIAPLHQPRFVGVVVINEPKTSRVGGGAIAAPIFARVMANVLRLLNVPPTYIREAV